MWRGTKVLMLFAGLAAVALVAAPGASSEGKKATQLVISGQVPPGETDPSLGPFGIWVWCEDQDASNVYAGACVGSLYFYDIALTKAVVGHVVDLNDEDPTGEFSVELDSRDGTSIVDCVVSGDLPATKGPTNTIHVACSTPDREGDLTNTVVVVT
jgi:hypothetical protein